MSSSSDNHILRYAWPSGGYVGEFMSAGSGGLNGPLGMRYGPNGNLFVAGNVSNGFIQYNGQIGAWVSTFVPPFGELIRPYVSLLS